MKKAPVTPTEIPITDPIDALDNGDWTLNDEVSSLEAGAEEAFRGNINAVTGGGGDVSFGNGWVNIGRRGGGCKATLSSIGLTIGFNDAFGDDGEGGGGECVKLTTVVGGLGMALISFLASGDGDGDGDGDGECGCIGVTEWSEKCMKKKVIMR